MNGMLNNNQSRIDAFAAEAQELVTGVQRWARRNGYGEPLRWLRGDPLGQPAHPVLVDGAGGYWMSSITLDILAAVGFRSFGRAADAMLALGLISAVPTVAAGALEFSALPDRSRSRGLVHGALAASATALYGASLLLRIFGRRHAAFLASTAASGVAIVAAHRGGKLVFEDGAGMRTSGAGSPPAEAVTLPFAAPRGAR